MLVLGFAELLGGGLLLTSAITGHSITDVLAGRASPIKPLTDGQASSAIGGSAAPNFRDGSGLPGLLSPNIIRPGDLRGVEIRPGADRQGTPTNPTVKMFAAGMSALMGGKTVTIGTGSNHSQMTASGNVSDHWTGNAMDIPVGLTGQLSGDMVATAALTLAGVKNAAQTARGGGIHNITPTAGPFKGKRIQIIWRAPDHYDHVHVGIQ